MKFSDAARNAARERAGGLCELCGTRLHVAHFHHRRPRGMGGTKSPETGSASNCLVIHPTCHADIESNRQRSLDRGWLVSQYQDPRVVPVARWDGTFLMLEDGTLSPA